MRRRFERTVSTLMKSSPATSALVLPAATSSATWRSVPVSCNGDGGRPPIRSRPLRAPIRPQGCAEFLEGGQRLFERRSGHLLLLRSAFHLPFHEERAREIERLRNERVLPQRLLEGHERIVGFTPIGQQQAAAPQCRRARPWPIQRGPLVPQTFRECLRFVATSERDQCLDRIRDAGDDPGLRRTERVEILDHGFETADRGDMV